MQCTMPRSALWVADDDVTPRPYKIEHTVQQRSTLVVQIAKDGVEKDSICISLL